jgi:hypothetical protein
MTNKTLLEEVIFNLMFSFQKGESIVYPELAEDFYSQDTYCKVVPAKHLPLK